MLVIFVSTMAGIPIFLTLEITNILSLRICTFLRPGSLPEEVDEPMSDPRSDKQPIKRDETHQQTQR